MEHCKTCGKLIEAQEGVLLCIACRNAVGDGGGRAPGKEATRDIPKELVLEEIEVPTGDGPCVRCRKHLAMVDSEFCLACQLELLNLLGDAAHELFRIPPEPPKPPVSSAVSLMSDIEDKRDRTGTSRLRVVGGVKIK